MKPLAASITAALALSVAGAAYAQTSADPLACARTIDGTAIRIGTEVLDAHGQRIGAVAITQCSLPAEDGSIKVFLDDRFGGQVKAIPLGDATATNAAVHLGQTIEDIDRIAPIARAATPTRGARGG